MGIFIGYRCSVCGIDYQPGQVTYTCPVDGGNLDVVMDYDAIAASISPQTIFNSKDFSIWRYIPMLPVADPAFYNTPLRSVGWTPVYRPQGLEKELGITQLWLKDDGRNPTASFKDRASAIMIARAREIGAEIVVTASTGNAGAALAGMAAAANHKAVIFAPKTAPAAKIAQLLVFGAQVFLVNGTYDQAFDLTIQAANEFGWYCRNTGYNPFTAEGKKTAAFEIWEQIIETNNFEKPLNIFVSVGDGNIISGIHKGFKDLFSLGWIKTMPRIFGVQAEGSAAIANSFFAGNEKINPVVANTIADSISVDLPRDGLRALRAVTQTNGKYFVVSDNEILLAIVRLGLEGIFSEPAASTAYAGLVKAVKEGVLTSDDPVLIMITGSGLKDIKAATNAVLPALAIDPTLDAVKKAIAKN